MTDSVNYFGQFFRDSDTNCVTFIGIGEEDGIEVQIERIVNTADLNEIWQQRMADNPGWTSMGPVLLHEASA